MQGIKKSILIALIAPVVLIGCKSTPDYQHISKQNSEITQKLTPLSEFFVGHALVGCENRITIENYDQVMKERASGTYGSPLANACVPISFETHEPESFYSDIISKAVNPDSAKEIIDSLKNQGYSDGVDGVNINKIPLKDGRAAQIMRFNDGDTLNEFKGRWKNRKEVLALIDEYVFLHELFHLSAMNFDKSIPTNIREGISDISAVITLSTKYNLTLQQTIDMANDIYKGRKNDASNNPQRVAYESSHFNEKILLDMVSYLEALQKKEGLLKRVASIKEANEYAMDIALDLNNIKRSQFTASNFYWDRGMDIPDESKQTVKTNSRISFSEILSISTSKQLPKTEPKVTISEILSSSKPKIRNETISELPTLNQGF